MEVNNRNTIMSVYSVIRWRKVHVVFCFQGAADQTTLIEYIP